MISAHLDPETGIVNLYAEVNGEPWRRAVMPHDIADLDAFAPDLPAAQRAAILADWQGRPTVDQNHAGI